MWLRSHRFVRDVDAMGARHRTCSGDLDGYCRLQQSLTVLSFVVSC